MLSRDSPTDSTIGRFRFTSALKSVAKVISGNIATNLITMVTSILIARWVGPYDMGVWNTALLVTLYSPTLQCGVFNGLNRELPYLVGARPVIADVDRESQEITAETIRRVLTPRTKAIVAVHLAGWPCEMDEILALARELDIKVVEDCAQAHGATYKGRPVGSLGDVAAFSFCQDKIMTTAGEGGMVTTESAELWNTMWSLKDHGKSYDAVYHHEHAPGFHWLHESFGTNWRLSEVQSAVGRIQLKNLPQWLSVRRKYAQILTDLFATLPGLRVTVPPKHIEHAYYKYYAFVRPEALRPGWTRDRIIEAVKAEGIPCFSGSCSEIYLEKAFPPEWRPEERLPVARELGETSLMFLVHPTLTEEHILATCEAVKKVMSAATDPAQPSAKDSR